MLIYSDPSDDGWRRGDKYPAGPWRPDTGRAERFGRLHVSISRRPYDTGNRVGADTSGFATHTSGASNTTRKNSHDSDFLR